MGPVASGAKGADGAPASVLRQARLSLLLALLLLTGATWALTLYHDLMMEAPGAAATSDGAVAPAMPGMAMGGMPGAAWSAGGAAFFLASWVVMMAAMMLPAAAPMIVLFDAARRSREGRAALSTWIFVSGYLLVWLAAGVPAYAAIETANALGASWTDPAARVDRGSLVLGAILLGAGLYQFTPLKRVCLRHCRSPLAFFAQHWRDGRLGALRLGVLHGAYCLGCCWALFAVLVAVGVMSMGWMLLLTLVVFVEKVLPRGERVAAFFGVALVALGAVILGRTFLGPVMS
ncbi:MAG: DUF2182 domain-containing protein [Rhodospirillales bacterium]|nr:DUF2182 domain-containing protein [Rhodospirillales bacterium]